MTERTETHSRQNAGVSAIHLEMLVHVYRTAQDGHIRNWKLPLSLKSNAAGRTDLRIAQI